MKNNNLAQQYHKTESMEPTKFYGNMLVIMIMFIGVLIGVLLIVAKFGISASIGGAIIGLALGMFLCVSPLYIFMENDAKK